MIYFHYTDGSVDCPETSVTTSPMTPQLPAEFEQEIIVTIQILQVTLTTSMDVVSPLELCVGGTFPTDSKNPTCKDFFSNVMEYLTILVNGDFGSNLEAAAFKITSVPGLSGACDNQTIINLRIVIDALKTTQLNIVATISKLTNL